MVIRYLINMLYIAHMTHMIDDIYISTNIYVCWITSDALGFCFLYNIR